MIDEAQSEDNPCWLAAEVSEQDEQREAVNEGRFIPNHKTNYHDE